MPLLTRVTSTILHRVVIGALVLTTALGVAPAALAAPTPASPCQFTNADGTIQHVIYLQFDNVHFTRDNPNVPSDLEQMPHLLNFIEGNGVLDSNHHTPLIAHTATDILTSLTGLYGDRMGVPVANSFLNFNTNGSTTGDSSFTYWTEALHRIFGASSTDTSYNMITTGGANTPAPWVAFTRAGCDFGAVATANTVLENVVPDAALLFGAGSPQDLEAHNNPKQAIKDFEGIAVHCAQSSTLCSTQNGGVADVLPNEPGGYTGYNALIGHAYVAPQIAAGGNLTDLSGNPINGFPGFDGMSAAVSLGYVAAMQEHGVPVTYAYISDAHDNHSTGFAYGPGAAGYVAALQAYDTAFNTFFTRLQNDGITSANTLFVVTSDEGDHFVGGPPSPANCDGVTIPCTYSQIGELTTNMTGLLATEQGVTTPFDSHFDSAPNFYLTGNPAQTDVTTRNFERASGVVTTTNPLTGVTEPLANYLADQTEMSLLHMVSADPARTPTFTMFAKPDYFVQTGAASCNSPCVFENPRFAWNHGDVSPDVNTTWLGLVGPGVKILGNTNQVWSDHTDIRPTMLTVLHVSDTYLHDGRALLEFLDPAILPPTVAANLAAYEIVGAALKAINAPVGPLGLASLAAATAAIESGSPTNDQTYAAYTSALGAFIAQRNQLALQMEQFLASGGSANAALSPTTANDLTNQGHALLNHVHDLADRTAR